MSWLLLLLPPPFSLEKPFVRHDPRISSVGILKISQPSGEGFPGSKRTDV